jgi:hypothetical protein
MNDLRSVIERLDDAISALSTGDLDAPAGEVCKAACELRLKLIEQLLKNRDMDLRAKAQDADVLARSDELKLKQHTLQREKWTNPLTVAVIVAALGLAGNFVNGFITNSNQASQFQNQMATEKIKLQNELIKEAIKPTSEKERAKSLVFFATNRLIELDATVVKALIVAAGTDKPVPGSSTTRFGGGETTALLDGFVNPDGKMDAGNERKLLDYMKANGLPPTIGTTSFIFGQPYEAARRAAVKNFGLN